MLQASANLPVQRVLFSSKRINRLQETDIRTSINLPPPNPPFPSHCHILPSLLRRVSPTSFFFTTLHDFLRRPVLSGSLCLYQAVLTTHRPSDPDPYNFLWHIPHSLLSFRRPIQLDPSAKRFGTMDSWRVAVLGDGGVGKTALAVQFTLNCFVETYDPTIEDAYRKQLIVDNKMCFVEVIDTAGQEEYATLRDQWVREGQGFILVYSIASRSTFERLEVFRQSMLKVKRQKPIFMLVGNKCDKTYEREVSREEGIALARSFGCEFMETSARTAYNVELLFTNLVRALRQTKRLESTGPGGKQDKPLKDPKKPKCVVM